MFFHNLNKMSSKSISSNNEKEISLKEGGKYLIRKIIDSNYENIDYNYQKNSDNILEDGIIERFYKKENNNINEDNYNENNMKDEIIEKNYKNEKTDDNILNNSITSINNYNQNNNNDNNQSINNKYRNANNNKNIMTSESVFQKQLNNVNTKLDNFNTLFLNLYTSMLNNGKNNNSNQIKVVNNKPNLVILNKNTNFEKKIKNLMPIYDEDNIFTGLYRDINYQIDPKIHYSDLLNLNKEIMDIKFQQILDKKESDEKFMSGIKDLKLTIKSSFNGNNGFRRFTNNIDNMDNSNFQIYDNYSNHSPNVNEFYNSNKKPNRMYYSQSAKNINNLNNGNNFLNNYNKNISPNNRYQNPYPFSTLPEFNKYNDLIDTNYININSHGARKFTRFNKYNS